jgi:hypothetical protein
VARVDYDIRFEGSPDAAAALALRLRAEGGEMSRKVRELLERTGALVGTELRLTVPHDYSNQEPSHVHLSDTVETSGIVYRPGGAGGGGFYEMKISVGREGVTPQLGFVLEGTGIYGDTGQPIVAGEGNLGRLVADRVAGNDFFHAGVMAPRWATRRSSVHDHAVRSRRRRGSPKLTHSPAGRSVRASETSVAVDKHCRDIGDIQ